jgi:hypothetical protein
MKSFLFACVAAAVIAVIGAIVLGSNNESVEKAYSVPSSVRVG